MAQPDVVQNIYDKIVPVVESFSMLDASVTDYIALSELCKPLLTATEKNIVLHIDGPFRNTPIIYRLSIAGKLVGKSEKSVQSMCNKFLQKYA